MVPSPRSRMAVDIASASSSEPPGESRLTRRTYSPRASSSARKACGSTDVDRSLCKEKVALLERERHRIAQSCLVGADIATTRVGRFRAGAGGLDRRRQDGLCGYGQCGDIGIGTRRIERHVAEVHRENADRTDEQAAKGPSHDLTIVEAGEVALQEVERACAGRTIRCPGQNRVAAQGRPPLRSGP